MARIRSIHPGIFTDESYMALSFAARELIKGIWCEADDGGVFDWKPATLKARIMPNDALDLASLLQELVEGRFIGRFEVGGRPYGAVRNFCKYQHPKKPTYPNPLPDKWRSWVGRAESSSAPHPVDPGTNGEPAADGGKTGREPLPDQSGTGGEVVGNRCDRRSEPVLTGVGVGEGEKKEESSQAANTEIPAAQEAAAKSDTIGRVFHPDPKDRLTGEVARAEAVPLIAIFDQVRNRHFPAAQRPWPLATDAQTAIEWREAGKSAGLTDEAIAEIVEQTCERQCRKMLERKAAPPRALGIFRDDVKADLARAGGAPAHTEPVTLSVVGTSQDPRWPLRVKGWLKHGGWDVSLWGPEPGAPGCHAPPEILVQCGFVLKESAA